MVQLYDSGVYLLKGKTLMKAAEAEERFAYDREDAKKGTISYGILQAHNVSSDPKNLKIKYDAITSHDLTYVGIIQTARASGLDRFPLPYILTCCHNSLCAVGGAIIMSSISASKDTTNEENNAMFKRLFLLSVANVGINVLMSALRVFTLGGIFY